MSKEVNNPDGFNDGDCVEVQSVYGGTGRIIKEYGIILSHQEVEMDDDLCDWLYTIVTPIGVDDYWAYEIKPVNMKQMHYNILSNTQKEVIDEDKQSN